jgi:hypothetical protein
MLTTHSDGKWFTVLRDSVFQSRSGVIALVLLGTMIVACSSGQEPEACDRATAAAAKNLSESLTAEASGAKLGKIIAIEIEDTGDAPVRGFAEGTTVLASNIKVPGSDGKAKTVPLVWVVGSEFANTGGGLAVGADYTTKSFSELGTDVRRDGSVGEYVTSVYDEHRDDVLGCLK